MERRKYVERGECCQTLDFTEGRQTFSALGDPSPPFLLVKFGWKEDNTLRTEEGNIMGRGVCCEQKKEVSLGPHCMGAGIA
jgi:hypothetical protein